MRNKKEKSEECFGSAVLKCIPRYIDDFLIDKQGEIKKSRDKGATIAKDRIIIRLLKTHPDIKSYCKERNIIIP